MIGFFLQRRIQVPLYLFLIKPLYDILRKTDIIFGVIVRRFGKLLYLCSGFSNDTIMSYKCKYVQNNIDMANVVTMPSKGQILVNIEDMSMLKDIKKAISLLKGVGRITVPRTKRLSSYERSLRDLDEGRVYDYDSLDDLIKEIEG